MIRTSNFLRGGALICACLIGGAGCFHKQSTVVPSPASNKSEIIVAPNEQGAKAATGGIESTITPVLSTENLAAGLPSDDAIKGFSASAVEETKDPVPMQDGTRSEFTTVKKTFTDTSSGSSIAIQTALTDTRSIPVLTAFIDSYSEYSNDSSFRKKIRIQDTDAWLTYQKMDAGNFGNITMVYRKRFLIRIDGNVGVTQDQLVQILNAYQFSKLK